MENKHFHKKNFLVRRWRGAQAEEDKLLLIQLVSDTMNHKGSADLSPLGVRAAAQYGGQCFKGRVSQKLWGKFSRMNVTLGSLWRHF